MNKDIVELVKATPNILGQIYNDLAQPSITAVGKALGTVFEFSTSFLLPIKLLNEKFKLNFKKRIDEYKEKLEQIPEEKQCEVHPQIGTPIIEKLSYTTNDEIADLFTTLLANASNIDMVNTAHPSFVNMIERMSPDEARILNFIKGKEDIEYCIFKGDSLDGNGYIILYDHITTIDSEVELIFPQNINAYLANFISLGILIDMNDQCLVEEKNYNQIQEIHKLEELKEKLVPNTYKSISVKKSFFRVTDFGKLFIKACIK